MARVNHGAFPVQVASINAALTEADIQAARQKFCIDVQNLTAA